jgi:hypothetical protein
VDGFVEGHGWAIFPLADSGRLPLIDMSEMINAEGNKRFPFLRAEELKNMSTSQLRQIPLESAQVMLTGNCD